MADEKQYVCGVNGWSDASSFSLYLHGEDIIIEQNSHDKDTGWPVGSFKMPVESFLIMARVGVEKIVVQPKRVHLKDEC